MLDRTVKAAKALEARGVNAQIMEIHTLKPIDREAGYYSGRRRPGAIVTVEDHSVIGGLGGAVAEVLATEFAGFYAYGLVFRIALQDPETQRHCMRQII